VNLNSNLKLKVTKTYENSSVSKILELVENSMFNKSKSERFITRFARIYTPAVVICALLTFLVPSIITGSYLLWLRRSLIFLVISCPCALVISVPLCFFASIGCASKRGILIKGANYLEALGNIETIVFDKTGTLTKGVFEITDICPIGCTKEELLENLSACEYYSNHPISKCIKDAFSVKSINDITDFENLSGLGVSVTYKGKKLYAGNQRLMEMQGIENVPLGLTKTIIHLCCDNTYMGYVLIADKIKKEAYKTIEKLKKSGIKTCMLTGDSKDNANVTKEKLGIEMVFSNLLPNDKVTHLNKILKNKTSKKSTVAYVGDGINDAPVLSLADVGISMGSLGSDAAIEASDIVITDDNIAKILLAIKICKSTITIVKQNVVFAIGVKFLIMLLGVMGIANMWAAVFADVGVSFIAILNALRAFKIR